MGRHSEILTSEIQDQVEGGVLDHRIPTSDPTFGIGQVPNPKIQGGGLAMEQTRIDRTAAGIWNEDVKRFFSLLPGCPGRGE